MMERVNNGKGQGNKLPGPRRATSPLLGVLPPVYRHDWTFATWLLIRPAKLMVKRANQAKSAQPVHPAEPPKDPHSSHLSACTELPELPILNMSGEDGDLAWMGFCL